MTHVNVHAELSERTRKLVTERGMKISQLSHDSGLSVGTISGLLRGQHANLRIGNVWALAGALNVDPFWLMGHDGDK